MVLAISTKYANTIATALSFISSMCLLLVNLGTPIIRQIYVVSFDGTAKFQGGIYVLFGIYGNCTEPLPPFEVGCTKSGLDDDFYISNGSTKFLLSMHAIAMGGQIDLFLKAKYTVEHPPFHGGTTKLGASGFTLVVIPLVFSFLSVFAFYIGGQSTTEGGGVDRSNGNGNMSTGITKQPSVSEYSPSYLYNDQQHVI
nr:9284_t:CDS:2 [Entrophospora candida]